MKIRKQVTRYILIVILCSLVVGTWAQGVKIYKSGSMIKVPYAELDSIVTYTEEDDKIEEERERINHPIVFQSCSIGYEGLENYHNTFSVYGMKDDTKVFDKSLCTFNVSTKQWDYSPMRYWDEYVPVPKSYTFIAYAPSMASLEWVSTDRLNGYFTSTFPLILSGTNLMEGNPQDSEKNVGFTGKDGKDCDVMVSNLCEKMNVSYQQDPNVSLEFKHLLSKLTVSINVPNGKAVVKRVVVSGFKGVGTFTSNQKWILDEYAPFVSYQYTYPMYSLESGQTTYFIESMIFPQIMTDNQQIMLEYEIEGKSYTHTLFLNSNKYLKEFEDNAKYEFKFKIDSVSKTVMCSLVMAKWDNKVITR